VKSLKASVAFLTLAMVLILFDVFLREEVAEPLTPRVPQEGRQPATVYQFGNRTVLDVPGQPRAAMIFLSPMAGDILVLFLPSGERGGCFRVLEVGGTFTLAPSPTCGRD